MSYHSIDFYELRYFFLKKIEENEKNIKGGQKTHKHKKLCYNRIKRVI